MGPTESGMLRDESSRLAIVSSGFHSPLWRQRRAGPMVRAPAEFRTPYGSFRPDADGHHQSASGADSLEWFRPDTRARVHERCRRGPQGDARCQVSPLEGGLVLAHVRLSGIWPASPRGSAHSAELCPCPAEALDSRLLRRQFAPSTMGSRMPPGPFVCPLSCCMPVIHEHQAHPSEVHGWYSTIVTSPSGNPSATIAEMITSHHPRSRHRYWQANPLPEMTFLHPSIAMHERIAS